MACRDTFLSQLHTDLVMYIPAWCRLMTNTRNNSETQNTATKKKKKNTSGSFRGNINKILHSRRV